MFQPFTMLLAPILCCTSIFAATDWPAQDTKDAREWWYAHFQAASAQPLGTEEDIAAIRSAVLAHLHGAASNVGPIHWVSQTVVITKATWTEGSADAMAKYFYALEKRGEKWEIITRYQTGIS
jgi:hypothetical protein